MARKHKYYKVTNSLDQSATSVHRLQYFTDKFTHAVPGSGCLVFNSREAARTFKSGAIEQRIWEVEVIRPVKLPRFRLSSAFRPSGSQLTDLWVGNGMGDWDDWPDDLHDWPDGTEAFRSVKLIRRVR